MLGILRLDFRLYPPAISSLRDSRSRLGSVHAAPAASADSADPDSSADFSLDGILYAGPIADVASAVIVSLFVVYELRKLNKVCSASEA